MLWKHRDHAIMLVWRPVDHVTRVWLFLLALTRLSISTMVTSPPRHIIHFWLYASGLKNRAKSMDNLPFPPRVIWSLLINNRCRLSRVRVDGYVAMEITVSTEGGCCQDNQRYLRNASGMAGLGFSLRLWGTWGLWFYYHFITEIVSFVIIFGVKECH